MKSMKRVVSLVTALFLSLMLALTPLAAEETSAAKENKVEITYVLNLNTKKFHVPYCSSVSDMKEKNKEFTTETREKVIEKGYVPCKRCNP